MPHARANPVTQVDPRLEMVFDEIRHGTFGDCSLLAPLISCASGPNDYYVTSHDFPDYLHALEQVDEAYKDKLRWAKMSVLSTARSGKFSSDRSIREYAEEIWGIQPCRCPGPIPVSLERIATSSSMASALTNMLAPECPK